MPINIDNILYKHYSTLDEKGLSAVLAKSGYGGIEFETVDCIQVTIDKNDREARFIYEVEYEDDGFGGGPDPDAPLTGHVFVIYKNGEVTADF